MQKLILLISTAFLTVSLMGQKMGVHSQILNKSSQKKETQFSVFKERDSKIIIPEQNNQHLIRFKEANIIKQKIDSVVAQGYDKEEYIYDANGNMIRNIYFEWDGSQWRNSVKYEQTFDASGNQTQNIIYNWDNTQWVNSLKDEFTYDGNGNQTQNTSYIWSNNQWMNYSGKDEYTFDANGNQTQHISYVWVDDQYLKSDKDEFSFDIDGNQTQNIRYFWDGDEWTNFIKYDITYDGSGKQTQNISYSWENNQWVNYSNSEFLYDSNGNIVQIISYSWDGSKWSNSEKYETVYDSNGNIEQAVYSFWEVDQWLAIYKDEYLYDANGNMILKNSLDNIDSQWLSVLKEESVHDDFNNRTVHAISSWDMESEQTENIWKTEYTYDNSISFDQLILPFSTLDSDEGEIDLTLMFKHKLTHLTYYEGEGDNWVPAGDYTIYYSEQSITGNQDFNSILQVGVYPNPATNHVIFTMDGLDNQFSVELFDILGKLVFSQVIYNNQPVSIESLAKGLYFYRISANQDSYTGRFMVK